MATSTPNLKLTKPELTDIISDSIASFGENADIIDGAVKDLQDKDASIDGTISTLRADVDSNSSDINTNATNINNHKSDKNNPHNVTSEQITVIPAVDGSVSGNDYPIGATVFNVTNQTGYPHTYGTVLTVKVANNRMSQLYFEHAFNDSQIGMYFRHWNESPNRWTEWRKLAIDSDLETVRTDLNNYKSSNDSDITNIQGRLDDIEARLSAIEDEMQVRLDKIEARLLALEN